MSLMPHSLRASELKADLSSSWTHLMDVDLMICPQETLFDISNAKISNTSDTAIAGDMTRIYDI